MVIGQTGASGAIVQGISMVYKWGADDVRIQGLNLVENRALDPIQLLLEVAQTNPHVVKVFEKC